MDYRRPHLPAAQHWDVTHWDDARGVGAFERLHDSAEAALDWAMEMCSED
ncbi:MULTISPECIES: hypothetical protein [unclassified Delftia]|nr:MULTISPECIES: hypothetical protein [unclassified Delftia]MBK0113047.1 hypothetical protein [Delftia sp. S65]MBK0118135.1 hypothetical protein [Delftia sp. S67]MBK0129373.1 hypothetical protein [Delftia sp. S66]